MIRKNPLAPLALVLALALPNLAAAGESRTYTAGRFALFVDGEALGHVASVTGGHDRAEVVVSGWDPFNKKAIIGKAPVEVEVGLAGGPAVQRLVQGFTLGEDPAVEGAFVAPTGAREFAGLGISQVAFPGLDASSKDPAYLTVVVEPEFVAAHSKGGLPQALLPSAPWAANGFRFELGSLPCQRVSRIESFVLEQSLEGGPISVPNLRVTLSGARIDEWQDFHESFLLDGHSTDADELSGSLTFVSPEGSGLGVLELGNVGIVSLEPVGADANGEAPAEWIAELYVESMVFEPAE